LRIRIARIIGIDLWLHATWFVVFALVTWVAANEYDLVRPDLGLASRLLMGSVTALGFFAGLTLHEVAHAVVARRFGVRVHGITLFMFGGVAEIEGQIPTPSAEFSVALAGPATSVLLASVFGCLAAWASNVGWEGATAILTVLAVLHLGVAVFNLLPGLPLDGGRLVRAGIWRRTGSFARGTRFASGVGTLLAATLVAAGVVIVFLGNVVGLWYALLGAFIWALSRAAARAAPPGGGALA
jgi:Zn-dependent protease